MMMTSTKNTLPTIFAVTLLLLAQYYCSKAASVTVVATTDRETAYSATDEEDLIHHSSLLATRKLRRKLQDSILLTIPAQHHPHHQQLTATSQNIIQGGIGSSPLQFPAATVISTTTTIATKSSSSSGGLRPLQTSDCQDEVSQLAECISGDSDNDLKGCISCIDGLFPLGFSCANIDVVCPAANRCSECGGCADQITKFLSCNFGCGIDVECGGDDDDENAPTLTCPDEASAVSNCFDTKADRTSCVQCVVNSWNTPVEFCSDIIEGTCNAVVDCDSCGDCGLNEVVQYFQCLEPNCCFPCTENYEDCLAADPAPVVPDDVGDDPACPDESAAFVACFPSVEEAADCLNCITDSYESTVTSCSDLEEETCGGVGVCPQCEACVEPLLDLSACVVNSVVGDVSCSISCTSDAAPPPSPSPPPSDNEVVVEKDDEKDEAEEIEAGEDGDDGGDGDEAVGDGNSDAEVENEKDEGEETIEDSIPSTPSPSVIKPGEAIPIVPPSFFVGSNDTNGDAEAEDEKDEGEDTIPATPIPSVIQPGEAIPIPSSGMPTFFETFAPLVEVNYDCPDDLKVDSPFTFIQGNGASFAEGTGEDVGDRFYWSKFFIYNDDNEVIGRSSGMCTLIEVADFDGNFHYLCNEHLKFNGDAGSTLALYGTLYGDAASSTEYTITGGSGCFAGVSGTALETPLDDGTFETVVTIE